MTDDKAYMAEVLEGALRCAEIGIRVHAGHAITDDAGSCSCGTANCENAGKHPRFTGWKETATCDPARIKTLFGSDAEISSLMLVTGKESNLTIADVDGGPGKVGLQTFLELIQERCEPPTLKAKTGGGGFHFFFQYTDALKTGNNRLGKHIDVKNDGGYIIAPPSRHRTGGVYEWINWGAALAPVPEWMLPHADEAKRGRPRKDDPYRRNYSLSEVREMLARIPADDRDFWRAVYLILGREYNRSDEAWAIANEWADKWDGQKGRGHDAIAHQCFYDLSQEPAENELSMGTIVKWALDHGWVPRDVLELNKQYAVVWMGGDCVILREHTAPDTGLLDVSFCTKAGLKLFHANEATVNPVDQWLKHPKRRTYQGLIFQPGSAACDSSLYNLWQGFAVEPKQGDCSLYLVHLRDNICRGNEEIFLYLMAWMANVVQTPGNRPGVAIVLRGKQGTGKGVFAKGFGYLFKPHFAHITNSHQLVGRFNALLKKAVVVFADEAFWAGDKQAEGTLNALVSEETHNIEPKGIDPFSVNNLMHLIVASNHEWVVPASSEARRWGMLDVSEAHLQDHAYFKAIDTQMKNGGSGALLYELLHYDGSGVDLWTVPKTAALGDQKVHSMTPVEKFWFNCLKTGRNIESGWAHKVEDEWAMDVCAWRLYDEYIKQAKDAGVTRRAMEMELADALKRMVPSVRHGRMTICNVQVRGWMFPPLEVCRTAFDEYMKWEYSWPKDDLDDLRDEVVSSERGS